jgi:hypothetical protein
MYALASREINWVKSIHLLNGFLVFFHFLFLFLFLFDDLTFSASFVASAAYASAQITQSQVQSTSTTFSTAEGRTGLCGAHIQSEQGTIQRRAFKGRLFPSRKNMACGGCRKHWGWLNRHSWYGRIIGLGAWKRAFSTSYAWEKLRVRRWRCRKHFY